MLLGIGIDILSLTRFERLITRRSPLLLAKRICSPNELVSFKAIPSGSVEISKFLSTRWVLKEAAYKSLNAHIPLLTWKSLTISHSSSGQPIIHYIPINGDTTTGREVGMVGQGVKLMCTLSHDAGVVVGVVIAQTKS